jgi:hypothetical protein
MWKRFAVCVLCDEEKLRRVLKFEEKKCLVMALLARKCCPVIMIACNRCTVSSDYPILCKIQLKAAYYLLLGIEKQTHAVIL